MATLTGTQIINVVDANSGLSQHYKFTPFAASGDVGTAVNVFRHTRVTVQMTGNDYTGSLKVIAEGSLEDTSPTTFFPLTLGDATPTPVEFEADGGMLVGENIKWIRLRATVGSGSADATGYILALI